MDGSVGWLEGWLIEIKNIVWVLVVLVQHSNDSYLRHLPFFVLWMRKVTRSLRWVSVKAMVCSLIRHDISYSSRRDQTHNSRIRSGTLFIKRWCSAVSRTNLFVSWFSPEAMEENQGGLNFVQLELLDPFTQILRHAFYSSQKYGTWIWL